jgi:tetratricopeptide (TPR) repeat protein
MCSPPTSDGRSGSPGLHSHGHSKRHLAVSDVAAAVGVVLLVTFAPLASLAALTLPRAPQAAIDAGPPPHGRSGTLIPLPADLPESARPKRPEDLQSLAVSALGPHEGLQLINLLTSNADLTALGVQDDGTLRFPYHYRETDALLNHAPQMGATPAAARLGAALMWLGKQDEFSTAARVAFALLHRAAPHGGCAPQLNLLLLLAADDLPIHPDSPEKMSPLAVHVRQQYHAATSDCPNDPTPGWLLGQFQSQLALYEADMDNRPQSQSEQDSAISTFAALREQFPRSVEAWTGAADVHLRMGLYLLTRQPFAARAELRQALQLYRQASMLERADAARIGEARALLALGDASQAAEILRHELDMSTPTSGPTLELVISAEEAAHDFAGAEKHARLLSSLGERAYERVTSLFPTQMGALGEETIELNQPLSSGLTSLWPLGVNLQSGGFGGGGDVVDLTFIPSFHPDDATVGPQFACPEWHWRRDAILAGHSAVALQAFPTTFRSTSMLYGQRECADGTARDLQDVARLEVGKTGEIPAARRSAAEDRRQNLWRWAGNLTLAERSLQAWDQATKHTAGEPMLRMGEILYLRGRFDDSADAYAAAGRRFQDGDFFQPDAYKAGLGEGAALIAAGRAAEGSALLTRLDQNASVALANIRRQNPDDDLDSLWHYDVAQPWLFICYYARLQLADAERRAGQLRAADERYQAASELLPAQPTAVLQPQVLHNNRALVDIGLGRIQQAHAETNQALSFDPDNPVFLMTAGYVAERSGDTGRAAAENAAALTQDPGAFSAANDLAVERAREGRLGDAIVALRSAVDARPDFALGWFNLSVAYAQQGNIYASQGALARALHLEPDLKDRKHQMTTDANVYVTGLDLSKPLPPHWTLSDVQRRQPAAAAGLLALWTAGLVLLRNPGSARTDYGERLLRLGAARLSRLPGARRMRHPVWAVGATVAAFCLALTFHGPPKKSEFIAYGLGILVLSSAVLAARRWVARKTHISVANRTWIPGVVVGLLTGGIGTPLAPLPVVHSGQERQRIHGVGPMLIGLLAAVLLVEAAWLGVPLAQSLGIAAVVMTASLLLPIGPLDGARLQGAGAVAGVGVVGAAVLILLGLI